MNNRVKEIRKYIGLTQEKFSQSIGISRSNITNIELGKIQLTDRLIKTICSVYNVDEHWLRTGEGEMFISLNSDDEFDMLVGSLYAENNEFKKKVIKAMLSLEDEDWIFIKKFIDKIKN